MSTNEQKTPQKRAPKDQAKSVTLGLDDETRQKLLNILWLNQKNNRGIHIPLSGALRFALCTAHTTIFGQEFDDDPGGAVDAFEARVEARRAVHQRREVGDRDTGSDRVTRIPPAQSTGKSPGQLAKEMRDAKPPSERGIGKPEKPVLPDEGRVSKDETKFDA